MGSTHQESIDTRSKMILDQIENGHDLSPNDVSKLLAEFRILTREKSFSLNTLDKCAHLLVPLAIQAQVESQKCLSNLIMNYEYVRDKLVEPYVTCAKTRLESNLEQELNEQTSIYQSIDHKKESLYYDLRIIFLLSAFCPKSRNQMSNQLSCSIIQLIHNEINSTPGNYNYLLLNEAMKVLFNLTLGLPMDNKLMMSVLEKLLDISNVIETKDSQDVENNEILELQSQLFVNTVHLLTNMPEKIFQELSKVNKDRILKHLKSQLISCPKESFRSNVLPVLNVCLNISKFDKQIRKRWYEEILQSNEGFERRPEEYEDFRGRLVKLMTSVDVQIKDLAADFLYSLCDGDTEKFITYTGFGNSAAYLSTRKLLGKPHSQRSRSIDDPEYEDLKDRLDPITGKIETIKRNPMDDMTDEEKEYHAVELANAITKLTNLGVMKPMRINDDKSFSDIHPDSLNKP